MNNFQPASMPFSIAYRGFTIMLEAGRLLVNSHKLISYSLEFDYNEVQEHEAIACAKRGIDSWYEYQYERLIQPADVPF